MEELSWVEAAARFLAKMAVAAMLVAATANRMKLATPTSLLSL